MDIFDLPQEILSHVLSHLRPRELLRFGLTCREAHAYIKPTNQLLWHDVFLNTYDDPQDVWSLLPASARPVQGWEMDWFVELRRRLAAEIYVRQKTRESIYAVRNQLANEVHVEAILAIIETTKFSYTEKEIARGMQLQHGTSHLETSNTSLCKALQFTYSQGVEHLIHDSLRTIRDTNQRDQDPARNSPGRPITRSMTTHHDHLDRPESASRLHVLYGMTEREKTTDKSRGVARRLVYNWSLSNASNEYGPFHPKTGGVNWQHLEAVCSVMGRVFQVCTDGHLSMPTGLLNSLPYRTIPDPTIPEDWARVTGSWLGTYAFLDYAHLFAFNTWRFPRPNLDDEPEACGDLMRLELSLDKSDQILHDPRLQTSLPVCHDLPLLRFSGTSRGHLDQLFVRVRGFAHLVPTGREVRWRFIISYGGADQWQLEGVQAGGIRSGGVFGLWSQCDHEEHGPVGPFCYFPMELCKPTSLVVTG